MQLENLFSLDYGDFHILDNAIGELMLRKTLHRLGINQRELKLKFADYDDFTEEIIMSGIDAAHNVFELLGYTLRKVDKEQLSRAIENYELSFVIDLAVPKLNGWSAQRLNTHRGRWENCLTETRSYRTDYEVSLKTSRARESVLRFKLDIDSASQFFFQLPMLVENFLHWKEDMLEVVKGDSNQHKAA